MTYEIKTLKPKHFPQLLKEITDPPKSLYYRGSLPKDGAVLLAVVGSRNYTQYGKDACEKLISELSPYNITIVSGLALGIDSIAHRKALSVGLHTVAIPGSGLDDSVIYPSSHKNLAQQILNNGGALLSEFEPKMKAAPYTFPKRNRIIAGMSKAVLIVEATPKSGTLITAKLAMEYNRDVLTVPGSIYSSSSSGPHGLIINGAALIRDGKDIAEALGINTENNANKRELSLSQTEELVYKKLSTPMPKEDLASALDLNVSELNITLSTLELKGIIKIRLGKIQRS